MAWDGLPTHKKIETETVRVTPGIAQQMLTHNTQNRPMSEVKVRRIVHKMQSGDWIFTHQGVAFSKDGRLIDGQHRLQAVVNSGKYADFLVTYNLDERAFDHIDTGGKRTAADLLAIRCPNVKNKVMVCGVANAMLRGIVDQHVRPDTEVVADFADWYKELISAIVGEFSSADSIIRKAAVISAFCNAARPPDEWTGGHGNRSLEVVQLAAMRFVAQEWTGANDPLKRLFNRMISSETSKRTGGKLNRVEQYGITVSGLRAELRGKELATITPSEIDWGMPGDYGQKKISRKKKIKTGDIPA